MEQSPEAGHGVDGVSWWSADAADVATIGGIEPKAPVAGLGRAVQSGIAEHPTMNITSSADDIARAEAARECGQHGPGVGVHCCHNVARLGVVQGGGQGRFCIACSIGIRADLHVEGDRLVLQVDSEAMDAQGTWGGADQGSVTDGKIPEVRGGFFIGGGGWNRGGAGWEGRENQ